MKMKMMIITIISNKQINKMEDACPIENGKS